MIRVILTVLAAIAVGLLLGGAATLIQDNQLRDSYSGIGNVTLTEGTLHLARDTPPVLITPTPSPTPTLTPAPTATPTPVACTVALYKGQVPASNTILLRYTFTYACNFPANMTGSDAHLVTAPTAEDDYPVQKGSGSTAPSSIGTVNCALGSKDCTFNAFSAASFAAGDYIEVDSPNPADTTADGLYITFLGSKP